jgi:hypothetical protein
MSKEHTEMEDWLRALHPAAPDRALKERVRADLSLDTSWAAHPARRMPRWLAAAGWAGLGAAAAVMAMALITPSGQRGGSPLASGARALDTGKAAPAHPVQIWSVERHAWIDPQDGAEVIVEIPREPRVTLPVNFQ